MAQAVPKVGVVSGFDVEAGLGAVRGDDGAEWAFHCTRISDGSRTIDVGARVVFEIGPGAPGRWEAVTVVKV